MDQQQHKEFSKADKVEVEESKSYINSLLNVVKFSFKKEFKRFQSPKIEKLMDELHIGDNYFLKFTTIFKQHPEEIKNFELFLSLRDFYRNTSDFLEHLRHRKLKPSEIIEYFKNISKESKINKYKEFINFKWVIKNKDTGEVRETGNISDLIPDKLNKDSTKLKKNSIHYGSMKKKGWKKSVG
jgi:hypothetical protein